MKPAPFSYLAPGSLDEALSLVASQADYVVLAGGQSLVPMLNFRLARPSVLVDLNGVAELSFVRVVDGGLRIGAMTRQAVLERSGLPLLTQVVRFVGHRAIRSRGTVGGSVAHADPRAELPVALVALDARVRLESVRGSRWVAVSSFLRGPFMTVLESDELLVEIEVPPLPTDARCAFVERSRTHGDFAVAGAAVVLAPDDTAAIALLGAGGAPVRAVDAERALSDGFGAAEVGALAGALVSDEYQRALLSELVRRAVSEVKA